MKKTFWKIFIVVIILVNSTTNFSQISNNPDSPILEDAKKRPDLTIDINQSTQLKIAVRKNRYLIGEMIILDIAMLYLGKNEIYIPPISGVNLIVTNQKGTRILVPYILKKSSQSFSFINSNHLDTDSIMILVGCQKKILQIQSLLSNEYSEENVFKRNLFLTWGDSCLDVKDTSKITITAEINNSLVLVSKKSPNTKTLVGKLKSLPLTIFVKK